MKTPAVAAATPDAGVAAGGALNLIRALIGVFIAVLRSVTSSLVLMISTMITAVVVVLLVGFFATGLTGVMGLRLSRRRSGRSH